MADIVKIKRRTEKTKSVTLIRPKQFCYLYYRVEYRHTYDSKENRGVSNAENTQTCVFRTSVG